MHVHISWAVALVYLLTWIAVVGSLNMLARRSSGTLSNAWSLIASPKG
jgi:hypothetical protein